MELLVPTRDGVHNNNKPSIPNYLFLTIKMRKSLAIPFLTIYTMFVRFKLFIWKKEQSHGRFLFFSKRLNQYNIGGILDKFE